MPIYSWEDSEADWLFNQSPVPQAHPPLLQIQPGSGGGVAPMEAGGGGDGSQVQARGEGKRLEPRMVPHQGDVLGPQNQFPSMRSGGKSNDP